MLDERSAKPGSRRVLRGEQPEVGEVGRDFGGFWKMIEGRDFGFRRWALRPGVACGVRFLAGDWGSRERWVDPFDSNKSFPVDVMEKKSGVSGAVAFSR